MQYLSIVSVWNHTITHFCVVINENGALHTAVVLFCIFVLSLQADVVLEPQEEPCKEKLRRQMSVSAGKKTKVGQIK